MHFLYRILLYLVCLGTFLVVDFFWLGVVAKEFYRAHLGKLMTDSVNWFPAAVFYLVFVAGLMVFVVTPAIEKGSVWRAVGLGFLFGVVTYSTYDLTNLATLAGWPIKVVPVDILWGGLLSVLVSITGYFVGINFPA